MLIIIKFRVTQIVPLKAAMVENDITYTYVNNNSRIQGDVTLKLFHSIGHYKIYNHTGSSLVINVG